jgi:hypothetical protein
MQSAAGQAATFAPTTDNTTMQPPAGMQSTTGQAAPFAQTTASSLEGVELKAGMTATVSLIVSQAQGVLLVPYAAITTEGAQKYVQVLTAAGETEKRAVTIGTTDYSYAEVTSGLTEGEKVIVSTTTSTKSTSSTQTQQQGGGMMMPGMGGPPGG